MAEENNDQILSWNFYLTVVSAQNLPNVRKFRFKTRSYAKVIIGSGQKKIKFKTDADNNNGLNPAWNDAMAYQLAESGVLYYGLTVVIKVYCKRTFGDRYIGEVHTTMKDLFENVRSREGSARLSLPITRGTINTSGILNFSYSFGERFTVKRRGFMKKIIQRGARIAVEAGQVAARVAIIFAIVPVLA